MNQLFIISDAAWAATTPVEVYSICRDLEELSLYSLPYPEIDIGVSIDAAVVWSDPATGKPQNKVQGDYHFIEGKSHPPLGPEYLIVYRGVTLTSFRDAVICGPFHSTIPAEQEPHAVALLRDLLMSLLATRNVRKSISRNKLAALGIGAKRKEYLKRYTYTTTISPPLEMEEDLEHRPTERTVCPHLRRGHIRHHQHYGPNNQFTRSIWIPPVFVNASEEFTRTRQAYNISLPPPPALQPTDVGSLEPIT